MESLGLKFKTAREERGLSIDQVARDTHIAKRYIVDLEEENFDRFPGDTYIMGFIRNYAEYLSMDPAELINLYRNHIIQQQPIPIEQLLPKKPAKPFPKPIFMAASGVMLLVGLGYFLFIYGDFFSQTRSREKPVSTAAAPSAAASGDTSFAVYTMGDDAIEQSFNQGDELIVKRKDASYTIKVEKIDNTVLLLAPVENLSLTEGEEAFLRLVPQGEALKVICRNIERGSKPKTLLFFDTYLTGTTAAGTQASPAGPATTETSAIGSTNEPSRVKRSQIIMESSTQAPFTIEMEFRGYCLYRYMADNQTREERYFRRGETFRTDIRREIRLWYSNAGSLRARISGNEIEFGRPGEVGASVIRWVASDSGRGFRLELIPMY